MSHYLDGLRIIRRTKTYIGSRIVCKIAKGRVITIRHICFIDAHGHSRPGRMTIHKWKSIALSICGSVAYVITHACRSSGRPTTTVSARWNTFSCIITRQASRRPSSSGVHSGGKARLSRRWKSTSEECKPGYTNSSALVSIPAFRNYHSPLAHYIRKRASLPKHMANR